MKRLIAVLALIAGSVFFVSPPSYADPPADTPAAENAKKPPDPPPPPPKKVEKQAPAVVNAPAVNQGPQNNKEIKGLEVKESNKEIKGLEVKENNKEIKGLEVKEDKTNKGLNGLKEIKELKEVKDEKEDKDPKVRLCHATGSESNPFVIIRVAAAAAFNGHLGGDHQNGEDIIPLFTFKGMTYSQNAGEDCGLDSEPPDDECEEECEEDEDESDDVTKLVGVLPDTGGSPMLFFPLGTLLILAGSYLVGWGRSARRFADQDDAPIDDDEDLSGDDDEAVPTATVTEPIRPTVAINPVMLASLGAAVVIASALMVSGRRSP